MSNQPESSSPPPSPSPSPSEPQLSSGREVVFWLFVLLAVATAVALLYFASIVDGDYRPRIYGALALDLALPVGAWFAFKRINRPKP